MLFSQIPARDPGPRFADALVGVLDHDVCLARLNQPCGVVVPAGTEVLVDPDELEILSGGARVRVYLARNSLWSASVSVRWLSVP